MCLKFKKTYISDFWTDIGNNFLTITGLKDAESDILESKQGIA